MSHKSVFELVLALGAACAEHQGDAKMTMAQYGKLVEVLPSAQVIGVLPAENRVIVTVNRADAEAAIAQGRKIERATSAAHGAEYTIASKTVYMVNVTRGNRVTYAEMGEGKGFIEMADGTRFNIIVGVTGDFFNVGEGSNPAKPAYAIEIDHKVFAAYSVVNLIKKLIAYKAGDATTDESEE